MFLVFARHYIIGEHIKLLRYRTYNNSHGVVSVLYYRYLVGVDR